MEEESDCRVCLRCGKLMPAEAAFCNSCGADLSAAPVPGLHGAVNPVDFAASLQTGKPPEARTAPAAYPAPPPYRIQAPGARPYPSPPVAPAYGYYPALYRQRRTEGMAIASLVCAIASFIFLPFIPAVAAITMGSVSRERIRKSDGELEGDGMALAGILVGVANVVLSVAILLLIVIAVLSQ